MEEGTITITEELRSPQSEFGQFQTPQMFELQESVLSPTLALVAACTQNLEGDLSQSFFHRTPLEFAPLRAAPDLSVVSHEGYPEAFQANNFLQTLISEVSADWVKGSLSVSQHPSRDGSDAWVLSQHPLAPPSPGSELTEDEDFSRAEIYIQDQHFMELPSRPLGGKLLRVPAPDQGPSLGRELPTHPFSEQTDSPSNSGSRTEGNRPHGANQSSGQLESGALVHGTVEDGQRAAEQQCSNTESRQTDVEPRWNSGRPEVSDIAVPYQGQPADEASQTTCPDASREPSASSNGHTVGAGLVTSSTDSLTPNNSKDDTAIEVLPSGSRGGSGESTSMDQEHKDSQLSPTAFPPSYSDSSFTPPVAGPIYQSTPASVPMKVPDPLGQGRRVAGHQPNAAGPCRVPLAPSFVKLESAPTGESAPGTTQSLPPLSYAEKVGARSLHGSPVGRPSFDSLVLQGLKGVSPRQRAYSAVADSLNHMLARINRTPTSDPPPKRSIAASFGVAGLQSGQSPGGPGGCSQPDSSRESPGPASRCMPDSSPGCLKDNRGSSVGPKGSSSSHSESLQPSRSAASLSPPEIPPDPKARNGQEKHSTDQSSSPPEHWVLSPCLSPLITAPTHQFHAASTDDGNNPPGSSLDTSQAGERTLTTSGHSLTSLEVDNYVPVWAPSSLTPEFDHFNIDDRIPVYLRNLGINQSPSSILGSKGHLREGEFTPSELEKLREAATEGFQHEEGASALDRDSGSTFYSDVLTHSLSIPLGSETGQNTPDPSELSLETAERRVLEPAASQCHSGYSPTNNISTQRPAQALSLMGDPLDGRMGLTPPFLGRASTPDSQAVSGRCGLLLSQSESVPDSVCVAARFCSSPSGEGLPALPAADAVPAAGEGMEPPLPSPGRLHCDDAPQQNDSFVGSKTLSEIRKLLGEAAGPWAWQSDFPSRTPDSSRVEAAIPGGDGRRELLYGQDRSRPVTVTQRSETEVEAVGAQPPSSRDPGGVPCSLPAQAGTAARGRLAQPVSSNRAGRAEPEGCSGATVSGVAPTPDPVERPPVSSMPTTLADGQAALLVPQLPSRTWTHTSGSVSGRSTENSSHTDTVDVRVSSQQQGQGPAGTRRNLSSPTQEMDPSVQGWEQTKQSVQPLDPLSIISDEDRRKIEEIKAELLQKSKTSVSPQGAWLAEAEDLSLASDCSLSADTGWPALPLTTSLSLNTARSHLYSQLCNLPDEPFDGRVQHRTAPRWDMEAVSVGSPPADSSQPARPIAAITFSSRRRLPPASRPPTTPLRTPPPPAAHQEPPSSARLSGTEPERRALVQSLLGAQETRRPQRDSEQGELLSGQPNTAGWSPAGLVEAGEPTPTHSPTRTVLSHIRVTLSPNRPDTPTACPANISSPSGKPQLLASSGLWTGRDLGPRPPHRPAPGTACNGPPYPPMPMPVPALCPTFPHFFDHSSEAKFPGTGQPLGQDGPHARILAALDSGKVDVSTQTSRLAPSPPAGRTPGETQDRDSAAQTERTPSVPAPVTGGTTAVSDHALTTDVPLMLPYKPAGSSKLFYVPSSGMRRRVGPEDSESSSQISRAASRDANPLSVPSHGPWSRAAPSKGTAEQRESRKAADSNVTRSKEEGGAGGARGLHGGGAAGFESLPTQEPGGGGACPRSALEPWELGAGSRRPWLSPGGAGSGRARSHPSEHQAWVEPWEQPREAGLSYKERAKAAARWAGGESAAQSGWPSGVPGDGRRGRVLDELWERFRRRQESVGSSTASELSLLERLDRLARFLRHPARRSPPRSRRPPPRSPPPPPRSPDTLHSSSTAEVSTDRIRNILQHRHSTSTGSSGSAGTPITETDSGSAASTIDTDRLVRAFGPQRVLPLHRLYSAVQEQRSSAHRRERRRRAQASSPGAPGARQAFSISSTASDPAPGWRPSTCPPRGPSSRLVTKKGARLVDQGVQTGSLEIVPDSTRRRTRDVGVTFPSPDPDVTMHRLVEQRDRSASRSSPAPSAKQSAAGARDRRRKGSSQAERKPSKGSRAPAVAWYIPAVELQGDWRKENVPVQKRSSGQLWGRREEDPWRWREPLRQKQLREQWASEDEGPWVTASTAEGRARGKTPSTLMPLTLREALTMNRPWFISHSQERVRRLVMLAEERKLQSVLQTERDRLFNQPPARSARGRKGRHPDYPILLKRRISKQEMLDRSKRLYEQLPEVTTRREEEKRVAEYQANRLRAELYKQKITNRVLGKKVSWQ